jgi:hypothetical protein
MKKGMQNRSLKVEVQRPEGPTPYAFIYSRCDRYCNEVVTKFSA